MNSIVFNKNLNQISRIKAPKTWKIGIVSDLFSLGRGRVISQEEVQKNIGIYPVYSSQTSNGGEMGKIDTYDFEGEWITWTTDGANAGTVFYRKGKFNCTNVCGTLKSNSPVDYQFFRYLLSTLAKSYVSYIGNPKLMNDTMSEIAIAYPEYPIQQKIANILSTIDGQIEKTEAIIAKYQAVKQGMLQDLFTRGIDVTTGELRPKYEDAPELYKDSPLGMIPKEWEVDFLDSQIVAIDAQPDHRTPASVEAGIPYLGINDVDEFGNIDYSKCRKVSEQILKEQSKRYTLRTDDIIFGKIGTIGQPKRLKAWDNVTISANVILIQPKENAVFIYWLLVSDLVKTQINNTIHTTSQPAFGMEKIRGLKVVAPTNEERGKIAIMLDQQEKLISSEKTNLMKLNKIKQGLMSDLLSGIVAVTA